MRVSSNRHSSWLTSLHDVTPGVAPLAIGLHINASKMHLQTLELDQKTGGGYKTMFCCKVFSTEGYRLHLTLGEAKKQQVKAIPHFKFRGPNGEEKFVDALVWGDVNPRFHSYVIAVMQALCKLRQLYAINGYGSYLVSNNVETTNNNVWTCCVQVPHCTDCAQVLDASVQDVFFDNRFKVWNKAGKVNKKCRVDPPK